jgi:DNA gyrase subunit A
MSVLHCSCITCFARFQFISNFLPLEENEKITSVISITKELKETVSSLVMVTKNGTIKKTEAQAFFGIRSNGLISINLKDGDELIDARFISEEDDVILSTHNGQAIRFKNSDVRPMGRTAGGVRGIKLKEKNDYVVSMAISNHDIEGQELLIISENGYGKKTKVAEYKVQNRGGSGVKSMNVTTKTGKIVGVSIITKEKHSEVIAMSDNSKVIRTSLESIPVLKRDTQGVRIMRLREGDKVASFIRF